MFSYISQNNFYLIYKGDQNVGHFERLGNKFYFHVYDEGKLLFQNTDQLPYFTHLGDTYSLGETPITDIDTLMEVIERAML